MARPSSPPPRTPGTPPGTPGDAPKGPEVRVKPGPRPGAEVYEIEYESEPPPPKPAPVDHPTPALGRPKSPKPAPHEQPTAAPPRVGKMPPIAEAKRPALGKSTTADLSEPRFPVQNSWETKPEINENLRNTSSGLGVPGPSYGSDTDFDAIEMPAPPTRRQDDAEPAARGSTDLGLDLGDDPNDALDIVSRRETASFAPPAPGKVDPLAELRERYALGDFSGALTIAEGILEDNKHNVDAQRYAESCRDVLRQMYAARLGPLDQVPVVAIPVEQLRWLTLDHRAGFLLSHVDGVSTLEEILDISGMPPLEAMRIIYELLQQKVIALQ